MIAYIERDWLDSLQSHTLFRYELSPSQFEDIGDVGMWVTRHPAQPVRVDSLADLPGELLGRGVELRVRDSLLPLKNLWQTSLHASGIRLRNAKNWGNPGWPHSRDGRDVSTGN